MTQCSNCGVELDDGLEKCPLCGVPVGDDKPREDIPYDYPSEFTHLQKQERRKYLWELCGIVAFSAIAVCTIIDLLDSDGIRWSLYCDSAIIAGWSIFTLFLYASRKPLIMIPGSIVAILAALFVIDLVADGRRWFFPVGLPLVIAVFCAAVILVLLYRRANLKGLNVMAAGFIILSGFCIITEVVLDKYFYGTVLLRWSLIVSVSILPVVLILFFVHYRLKRGKRLDSLFHI